MADPSPSLRPLPAPTPARVSSLVPALPLALAATALCFIAGIGVGTELGTTSYPPSPDPCALPAGIDVARLGDAERALVVRHAIACRDLSYGRISAAEFRDQLRTPMVAPPIAPIAVEMVQPAEPMWASSVRAVSSQYGDPEWAATQALGAPDVFPAGGDNAQAWASKGEDDRTEFLELGYALPTRINGVEILETLSPGAVSRVELIAIDGSRQVAYQGVAKARASSEDGDGDDDAQAYRRQVSFACTDKPIAAVRITLDSRAVPGWNEIDAVGVLPCR